MHGGTLKTPNTGIALRYRSYGSETNPPLVLLHRLATTLRILDYVAPVLSGKYWVVAYDQRGQQESHI